MERVKYRNKIILFLVFVLSLQTAKSQVYQLMPQYGYDAKRMKFDSTLQIPTFCGVPRLASAIDGKGAIAFDSCGGKFYFYNNVTKVWDTIRGGGGSSIDTTSLSNRINQRIDTLRRLGDSVSARINGVWKFQYKDSVGGGTTPNLQQVTDAGDTTTNDIYANAFFGYDGAAGKYYKIFAVEGRFSFEPADTSYKYFILNADQLTNNRTIFIPDTTGTLAVSVNGNLADSKGNITISTGSGTVTSVGTGYGLTGGPITTSGTISLDTLKLDSMYVPYVGAVKDVDLDTHILSAQGVRINGTAGNGDIHLKHQSADATATGQSTSLFANSSGDLKWKNAGNYYTTLKTQQTANRIYSFQNKSYTLGDSSDIAARVLISDTSAMLSPYFRKVDTASLSNRINQRLLISDTSAMLGAYLRKVDTASLSNRINQRLLISDTATMLNSYLRKIDTASLSNRINQRLLISDTAAMLGAYLRKLDTASLSSRIDAKQTQLNGTGFVKASGTTISYDNSTYITDYPVNLGLQALGSTIKGTNLLVRSWMEITNSLTMTSQRAYFVPIYLVNSTTITGVKWFQTAQGVFTSNNYNGVGLYSYSGGTLTLVASSTNDTTMWKGAVATQSKAFSSTYSASAGIYFIGLVYSASGATTAPGIGVGTNTNNANIQGDLTNSAKLASIVNSQTSLPSSQAMSGTTGIQQRIGAFLY
jgi:hypothetical protein